MRHRFQGIILGIAAGGLVAGPSLAQGGATVEMPATGRTSGVVEAVASGWSADTGIVLTDEALALLNRVADPRASTSGGATASGSTGSAPAQTAAVTTGLLTPYLSRFPSIRLSVRPAPPPDYVVEINGKIYQANAKGYGVPANERVRVRVSRRGKPDCIWEGTLAEGADQLVSCRL